MNIKLINFTPHDINIVGEDGKVRITFPKSGQAARVKERVSSVGILSTEQGKIPLLRKEFEKEVEGLPPLESGKGYIVSLLVCQACPHRPDLFVPQDSIRGPEGRIIGVKGLQRNPFYDPQRDIESRWETKRKKDFDELSSSDKFKKVKDLDKKYSIYKFTKSRLDTWRDDNDVYEYKYHINIYYLVLSASDDQPMAIKLGEYKHPPEMTVEDAQKIIEKDKKLFENIPFVVDVREYTDDEGVPWNTQRKLTWLKDYLNCVYFNTLGCWYTTSDVQCLQVHHEHIKIFNELMEQLKKEIQAYKQIIQQFANAKTVEKCQKELQRINKEIAYIYNPEKIVQKRDRFDFYSFTPKEFVYFISERLKDSLNVKKMEAV